MKHFKSEIIAVGTELLLGQIANTNAQWLSEQLAKLGIDVNYHAVVGDNLSRVEAVFQTAQQRSDLIIVTGGLGPTTDDLTRDAFQELSNLELTEHAETIVKLENFFAMQGKELTVSNRKQALIFENASVLNNAFGMAASMVVSYQDKTWVFLPGVPREMKQIVTDELLPYLAKVTGKQTTIKSLILRFIGIGESLLAESLSDLIENQTNPTIAPLAGTNDVVIRLTAKAGTEAEAYILLNSMKDQILSRVGEYFYGIDDDTLEGKVYDLLKKEKQHIAAAESLTGGLFTNALITIPGASEVCFGGIVCYDESVKLNVLSVAEDTLTNFGTVSSECAIELAENVRKLLKTNIGISFTGVAGPNESEGKQVGTVFIAVSNETESDFVQEYRFIGDRQTIREKAVNKGLEILFFKLKNKK